MPGGAANVASSSRAQYGASIGPTVNGSVCRLTDAPSRRIPLGVAVEGECSEGRGGWEAHIPAVAEFFPQVLEGHRDSPSQVHE